MNSSKNYGFGFSETNDAFEEIKGILKLKNNIVESKDEKDDSKKKINTREVKESENEQKKIARIEEDIEKINIS